MGGADLLQQGDAVGVREAEIEDQHLGAELLELVPRFRAAPGEGHVVPRGEEPIIRAPEGRFILDEQHFAPGRGGPAWWGNICGRPLPSTAVALRPRRSPARTSRPAW